MGISTCGYCRWTTSTIAPNLATYMQTRDVREIYGNDQSGFTNRISRMFMNHAAFLFKPETLSNGLLWTKFPHLPTCCYLKGKKKHMLASINRKWWFRGQYAFANGELWNKNFHLFIFLPRGFVLKLESIGKKGFALNTDLKCFVTLTWRFSILDFSQWL